MKQQKHREMTRGNSSTCTGTVKRDGWTIVSIDGESWYVPLWRCDSCGMAWWSYFDADNGDEGYNMDDPEEDA